MRRLRINNRVGRSNVTPVIALLLALGLWWLPSQVYSRDGLVSLLLTLFTGYILIETNNTYQLLRIRSRMVSSVWLMICACMGAFHAFQPIMVAVFCVSVSYYLLFRTYQQTQPVTDVFHCFLLLSLGSLVFPPLFLFAPFFLWYLLVFMRSMSLRVFFAALVGVVAPFWFWGGWLLWQGDLTPLLEWWGTVHAFAVPDFASWLTSSFLTQHSAYFLLLILLVWTVTYYLLNSYDDKIRTRMMFYIYIFQAVLVVLYSLFQPDPDVVVPLLLLNVAPLLAHYFTFRTTWVCLVMFFLTLLALSAVAFQTLLPQAYNKLC